MMTLRLKYQFPSKLKSSLVTLLAVGVTLLSLSCMQTENSSSGDVFAYGSAGGADLEAVREIFRVNCAGCHQAFPGMTEAQFIAQGLVVVADPDKSSIYCRLAGSSGSCGAKNMPVGGGLPASDLDKIRTWILGL